MAKQPISFHIPDGGEINQAVREWVDSFSGDTSRQRSAAIREAIYHYHIRGTSGTLDSLHELVRQQSAQIQAIQDELKELRRRGFSAPEKEPATEVSELSRQKLKKLTSKFF